MAKGYGQLCPVAKASEVIAERWTPVIIRELLYGSRHFSELRRGIPLISPTVLSQRLRELEDAGVLERTSSTKPRSAVEYRLTEAGRALSPIIDALGQWGQRWSIHDLRHEDLDPSYLMWAAHRCLPPKKLGCARAVIAFELVDAPSNKRRWWIVVRDGDVELCVKHPGHDVTLVVRARVRALADVWLGKLTPRAALQAGSIELFGAPALARRFSAWCPRSPLADT